MNSKIIIYIFILFVAAGKWLNAQNIAINTTGAAAASGNMLEVTQSSTTNNTVGIYSKHTGAATNAYAIWAEVTGATNKYAIVVPAGGGNVGIGTTTPSFPLQIMSTTGRIMALIGNANAVTATDGVTQSGVTVQAQWAPTASTTDVVGFDSYVNLAPPAGVTITNAYGLRVRGTKSGAGTVTKGYGIYVDMNPGFGSSKYAASFLNGNVGVGTSAPAFRLTNTSTSNVLDEAPIGLAGQNTFVWIHTEDAIQGYASAVYNSGTTAGSHGLLVKTNNTTSSESILTLNSGGTDRMRALANGKVGIGTRFPDELLNVEGYVHAGPPVSTNYSGTNTDCGLRFTSVGTNASFPLLVHPAGRVNGDYSGSGGWAGQQMKFEAATGWSTYSADQLVLKGNGNVGIGTGTPSYKLEVVGAVYASGIVYCNGSALCSDRRYKKGVVPLSNALRNLLNLEGVYYYWDTEGYPEKQFATDRQIGFIAQEIEKLYPELVVTDQNGFKSVDYPRFTPILVEAIKDQQKLIRDLSERLEVMEAALKAAGIALPVKTEAYTGGK